jgi:DNA-binding transcriptional LysR family regulator
VKRTVAAGLGVAFVSRRAVALEIAHGLLAEPDLPELRFQRRLYLLWRSDAHLSAAAAAFKALVLNNVDVECVRAEDCR